MLWIEIQRAVVCGARMAPMSTLFACEAAIDADGLSALDFDAAIACEHDQHDQLHVQSETAWALIHVDVPCGDYGEYFICRSGWERLLATEEAACNVDNGGCGGTHTRSEINLRVIRLVNP